MKYTEKQLRGIVDFVSQREATSSLPDMGGRSYVDIYIDVLNKKYELQKETRKLNKKRNK